MLQTTTTGSLPKPEWLAEPEKLWPAWRVPASLMGLLKDKAVMVGAVTVTPDRVETPEEVAATIASALTYVDAERLLPCTNCGMAPLPYDIALGKLRSLAAGAALARKKR